MYLCHSYTACLSFTAKYLRRIEAIRDSILFLADDERPVDIEGPAAVQLPVEELLRRRTHAGCHAEMGGHDLRRGVGQESVPMIIFPFHFDKV